MGKHRFQKLKALAIGIKKVVRPTGFEPMAPRLGI
jgi:hypothetical protein